MSLTLSKLRRHDLQAKLYLKTSDGVQHGPLSVAELSRWAIQNRIPPGSKVSDDGAIWSPAEVIEELKMEWDAKRSDGRIIGPYNLLAIPLLVQDGSLEAGDTLVNRISTRSVQVRDLLKPGTTIVRKMPGEKDGLQEAGDLLTGSLPQRELFSPSTLTSAPQPLTDEAPPSSGIGGGRGVRKPSASRDSESGSQTVRLKDPLAGKIVEKEKALSDKATEAMKAKVTLDHEKSPNSEMIRMKEQEVKHLKERVKVLETEHHDLSARLAMSIQAVEKGRQNDETLKVGVRSKEAELARRSTELEKALNSSAVETARIKTALDQEKALHVEMRRTTGDREQQAAGRIKELEIEGRSLASRLAQATRALEDLTQKDDALQLESRRRDEESARRIEQLEKASSASLSEAARLKADQDYEKTLHAETRRLGTEKEKQFAVRIKELEADTRDLAAQLAASAQVSIEARLKDEAMQAEGRKRDADTVQRIDQLRRSLESRVADVSKLKAELDREKSLHSETRRLDGEREQQLAGRAKELEIKAREAAARMGESMQLAEERKRKYEAIQKESRQKESDFAVNIEQLQKSTEAATKAVREVQQRLEDEQAAHVQVQKEWWKREQELSERVARMEADTGSLSGIASQTRIDAEKQKAQDQILVDQGKIREMQLTQRLSQLQSEHEQAVISLDQARKKLAEKRMAPAPSPDPAVSEREKRLTLSLTQMEKQTENATLQMEQAKAETERLRKELVRTGERLTVAENDSRERIGELERTAQSAMQATEAAKKAGDEQSRMCRRLTEENAVLNSRIPGLQADNQKIAESSKETLAELAGARRLIEKTREEAVAGLAVERRRADDINKLLAMERKRSEVAMEAARGERAKLETRLERMMQEPARVEARVEKRRGLIVTASIASMVGVLAFLVGISIRSMTDTPAVSQPVAVQTEPKEKSAASKPVAVTNIVQKVGAQKTAVIQTIVIPATNQAAAGIAAVVPTSVVPVVRIQPAAQALKWPDVAVDGLFVTKTNKAEVIAFSYGIFSSMSDLKEQAKTDLGLVADQLRSKMDGLTLVVVGHTDMIPMSTNAAYSGNYELGMSRARAVVEYLTRKCNLPAGSLVAVSAGGTPYTPYSNADAESRKKNRTVVLRLVPVSDVQRVKSLYKNPSVQ